MIGDAVRRGHSARFCLSTGSFDLALDRRLDQAPVEAGHERPQLRQRIASPFSLDHRFRLVSLGILVAMTLEARHRQANEGGSLSVVRMTESLADQLCGFCRIGA